MTRRLDPLTLARAKRALRCPDCDSAVTIDQSTEPHTTNVTHDDTCPTLAALQRQGRAHSQVAIIRTPGQSAEEYAAVVAEAAQILGRYSGGVVRLAETPYSDLGGTA